MIERFINRLRASGLNADHRDVRDILWLSLLLPEAEPELPAPDQAAEAPPRTAPIESAPPAPGQLPPEPPPRRRVPVRQESGPGIYVPSPAHASEGTRRASAVRVPAASALPAAAAIGRALRPLSRRRFARHRFEFDAETTVEHYADTLVLVPMLKPELERWFEVALVVDDTSSMSVWKPTAAALHHLLERQGAFSSVRRWRMIGSASRLELASESGLVHHWRQLVDPTARRIVLVMSDCVGPIWRGTEAWRFLDVVGRTTPVALLQVFPERLWPATAIGDTSTIVRNRLAGVPNIGFEVEGNWWLVEHTGTGVAVPVVTLEPDSVAAWSRLVMAVGHTAAPAIRTHAPAAQVEAVDEESPQSAVDRVGRYKGFASPLAYELAVYFSAVPLTLPVMRLVQQAMLPASRQVHLAEFFVGGLIERVTPADAAVPDDEVVYDFADGVRDHLQGLLTRDGALRVLQTVSHYLERNFGHPLDFRALIPHTTGDVVLPEFAIPFATLGARVLARVGHLASGQLAPTGTLEEEEYAPGLTTRYSIRAPSTIRRLAWSPDGRYLAMNCDDGVWVVDVTRRAIATELSLEGRHYAGCSWSHDTLLVAADNEWKRLTLMEVHHGQAHSEPVLEEGDSPIVDVACQPGGNRIAVTRENGAILMCEPLGRKETLVLAKAVPSRPLLPPPSSAWRPDGRRLATIGPDGNFTVRHFTERSPNGEVRDGPTSLGDDGPYAPCAAAWAADRKRVAVTVRGGQIAIVDAATHSSFHLVHAPGTESLTFSPGDVFLAAGSPQGFVLWETEAWRQVARVHPGSQGSPVAFSPTSDQLALAAADTLHMLRVDADRLLWQAERTPASLPMPVFLSYSSRDLESIRPLLRRLDDLFAENLISWVARDPSPARDSRMDQAGLFLLIVSDAATRSEFVANELRAAIESPARPYILSVLLEPTADLRQLRDLERYEQITANARVATGGGDVFDELALRVCERITAIALPWAAEARIERWREATVQIVAGETVTSGFVAGPDGLIVTTDYALSQFTGRTGPGIRVIVNNTMSHAAHVVGLDTERHLALLRAASIGSQPPAPLGDDAAVGDYVLAVGYRDNYVREQRAGTVLAVDDHSVIVSLGSGTRLWKGGGAVFGESGVVALIHTRRDDGSELCVPIAAIRALLEKTKGGQKAARLTISMAQVWSGDCLMIEATGAASSTRILVDGGRADTVRHGGGRFDAVVAAHPHPNHLEGLVKLLDWSSADVGMLLMNDARRFLPTEADIGSAMMDARSDASWSSRDRLARGAILLDEIAQLAKKKSIEIRSHLVCGDRLTIGGVEACVICPTQKQIEDARRYFPQGAKTRQELETYLFRVSSLALLLDYDGRRVLLTSDAYANAILAGLDTAGFRDKDGYLHLAALQIPSHGNRSHASYEFLQRITADTYFVSGATDQRDVAWVRTDLAKIRSGQAYRLFDWPRSYESTVIEV
jgi:WD40 repeat protein